MKKKIFTALFSAIFILIGFLFYINFIKNNEDWTTYEKTEDKINSYPSTKEELSIVHPNNKKNRSPAAVNKKRHNGRQLVMDNNNYDLTNYNFKLTNEINEKWQNKLSNNLLRFQDPQTKVLIKNEKSIFMIKNSKAQYVEKVTISYLYPNNKINSANALVDSETGKIINTWNHTKHEAREDKPTLTPTNLR